MDRLEVDDQRRWDFVIVDWEVVDDERLNAVDRAVYLGIARHARSGACWCSMATLARKSGLGGKRPLKKALDRLESLGYIAIQRSAGGRPRRKPGPSPFIPPTHIITLQPVRKARTRTP
jgi:hypothetical protein